MLPFESTRLYFRPLRKDDANGLFELDHDPTVHRYLGQRPVTNIIRSREMIRSIRAQSAAVVAHD